MTGHSPHYCHALQKLATKEMYLDHSFLFELAHLPIRSISY